MIMNNSDRMCFIMQYYDKYTLSLKIVWIIGNVSTILTVEISGTD